MFDPPQWHPTCLLHDVLLANCGTSCFSVFPGCCLFCLGGCWPACSLVFCLMITARGLIVPHGLVACPHCVYVYIGRYRFAGCLCCAVAFPQLGCICCCHTVSLLLCCLLLLCSVTRVGLCCRCRAAVPLLRLAVCMWH